MMQINRKMLALLAILAFFMANAQETKIRFGKVSHEELALKEYNADSSAPALVLGDIGFSFLEYNETSDRFNLVFERLYRVKILKKNGMEYADFSISLYRDGSDEEKMTTLRARTYNLVNGKISESKLGDEAVFDEIESKHWFNKKFTMPDVRVGSVIEVRYSIKSPFLFNLRDWNFQYDIPALYSEYEVRIPEYFNYSRHTTGYFPFTVNSNSSHSVTVNRTVADYTQNQGYAKSSHKNVSFQYMENIQLLACKDVPAMKEEPFTSSIRNYLTKVEYEFESYQFPGEARKSFTSTWEKVKETLWTDADFGDQIKKTGVVSDLARTISATGNDPVARMVAAYELVQKRMKWNGRYGKYVTKNLRQALNEGIGNSADINLLLVMLLRELNITASPVVLSTRRNGIVMQNHPMVTKFNHVIALAEIDGNSYLLDATDRARPYTMLPFSCFNGQGMVVSADPIRWIDIPCAVKSSQLYFGLFKLTPDGLLTGTLSVNSGGSNAVDERTQCLSNGEENYLKTKRETLKFWEVDSIGIQGVGKNTDPVTVSYQLSSEEITQTSNNAIYLNVLANMGQRTNPFLKEKRDYPIDFGCQLKDTYSFTFEIPEGYRVESVPEPIKLSLPDNGGSFKFQASVVGNTVVVNSVLQIQKTLFLPAEYPGLREFFTRIVAKHAESIVFIGG